MLHLYSNYHKIENKSFTDILKNYNQNLFRRNQISVFELDNKKINGVIMRVTEQGKLIINLEGMGEKVFGFKEIKLLY
jgi:BirA family biotin operon repressor/biotin-[acetyl-CoA-carboxylase] ligase